LKTGELGLGWPLARLLLALPQCRGAAFEAEAAKAAKAAIAKAEKEESMMRNKRSGRPPASCWPVSQ